MCVFVLYFFGEKKQNGKGVNEKCLPSSYPTLNEPVSKLSGLAEEGRGRETEGERRGGDETWLRYYSLHVFT